jgi:outer membrane protein TolC
VSGRRPFAACGAILMAALPLGCRSPAEQRAEADREVYALLAERRDRLFGDGLAFSIEPPADSLRARLLSGAEAGPTDLTLVQGLSIAAENSREYRERREALYLAALDLTLERWRFTLQERGVLGAQFSRPLPNQELLTGSGDAELAKLFGAGALVISNLGLELTRNLARADGWDVIGDVGLEITQPLLRGFGRAIVLEPLTQAERTLVYEVRAYERFRRTFAVQVATRIYRILQQADVVVNERANLANLELLRERNEALAAAGRLSDIQVDQARQRELRSRERMIEQEQRYETLVDDFKLFLGLPVEVPLACDAEELAALSDEPLAELERPEEELVGLALSERLDYQTALDLVRDAERRVAVAADALRAGLNLRARVDARSEEGRPLDLDRGASSVVLGVDLDLPIERLPERNAYRAAEIELEAARRSAEEQADVIRAELRELLREAIATRRVFEIQQRAVALAERRVESARLRLDAGRADTRDILEAQEDLLDAQNAATAALIDHHLAKLELLRDLELLRLDEQGLRVVEPPLGAAGTQS